MPFSILQSTESKKRKSSAQILIAISGSLMIAINIFSRAALGFSFSSHAAELWYVFHVRVSYSAYILRFVGSHDDVMDCLSCFYKFKSLTI